MVRHRRLDRLRRCWSIALAPAFKATQDQAEFLPDHYESIKAFNLQDEAFPQNSQVGAIVVFDRKDGGKLTEDDPPRCSRSSTA